jgi:hypothetical protein
VNGEYAKHLPKDYLKEQEDKTPLGRIAAEDIGRVVVTIAESFTFYRLYFSSRWRQTFILIYMKNNFQPAKM